MTTSNLKKKNPFVYWTAFSFLVLLQLIVSDQEVTAQETGEIINVNYKYKIAFTDLTRSTLKKGDIVEVLNDGRLVTYLMVSEAGDAISKLVPFAGAGEIATKADFQNILIGNIVNVHPSSQNKYKEAVPSRLSAQEVSVPPAKNVISAPPHISGESTSALNKKVEKLMENYTQLSNNMAVLLNEKNLLESEFEKVKAELNGAIQENENLKIKNRNLADQIAKQDIRVLENKNKEYIAQIDMLNAKLNVLRKKLESMAKLIEKND